jgi:hypothetical protein
MDSTNTAKQADDLLLTPDSHVICTTTYVRGVSTTRPSHTSVKEHIPTSPSAACFDAGYSNTTKKNMES